MGLGVSVGLLAYFLEQGYEELAAELEDGLAAASLLLEAGGLPPHVEPRDLPPLRRRTSLLSLSYSAIHHLRRAYAHRRASPGWLASPFPPEAKPTEDPLYDRELYVSMDSHLICHSDAEGFYLPVDFADVIYASPDDIAVPGGMVGSSYRLLEELVELAPALGIRLVDGLLSDQEAERVSERIARSDGLSRELGAWIVLYESARLSIQHGTAITFG